jgi:hypothetical protein
VRREFQQSISRTVAQDALLAATHFLDEVNKYFNYVLRHGDHPDSDDDLYLAWTSLPLTTSAAVYEAGDTLIQECLDTCNTIIRARTDSGTDISLSGFHRARAVFINHVRQERGLPVLVHEALNDDSSGLADPDEPTSVTD